MMMRSRLPESLLVSAIIVLTSNTFIRSANISPGEMAGVQVIDVTAKKYEFNPSPIRVKQDTRVELKITATDHAHGFKIKELPNGADPTAKPGLVFPSPRECQKIEKGQSATIDFVAQSPGTYPFRCCTHSGWDHRAMKGELIVER